MGGVGAGLATAGVLLLKRKEPDLRGQVALITGSSRGLGFLLAREFAARGCKLVICARDEMELQRARRDLEQSGAEVLAVGCDTTDQSQVESMVAESRRRYGGIDILVNNAGAIQVGPIHSMTLEDFEEALKLMFWGAVYATLAVLPEMVERKSGRIVNITSIGGKVSVPHLAPYSCAKFAAVGLSEGLRAELKHTGVRVVTIVPGLMRTGSFLNAYFKGDQESEFRWFSLGATLPLISMDAERAARQIVRATARGDSERILSLPAAALARFHGVFPGLTSELLSWTNRLILPAGDGKQKARGMDLAEQMRSRLFDALTSLGRSAAERFHQYPGPVAVKQA
ncbi:MAG: SDR family NAD(P)-dependent oxidoreductase [Bryobacteraceae bacterium]|nr:SDR family NAD(P)-dependent oxidoreductase [Bryobacteraceae bacterium]